MNTLLTYQKEIAIVTGTVLTIALIKKSELLSKLFNKVEKEPKIILEKINTEELHNSENTKTK